MNEEEMTKPTDTFNGKQYENEEQKKHEQINGEMLKKLGRNRLKLLIEGVQQSYERDQSF